MAFFKSSGAISAVVALAAAASVLIYYQINHPQYVNFKITHNKPNAAHISEELARAKIFWQNKLQISQHNENFARGKVTFEQEVNKFSDMTEDELHQRLGLSALDELPTTKPDAKNESDEEPQSDDDLPASVDWREKGAVTPTDDEAKLRLGLSPTPQRKGLLSSTHVVGDADDVDDLPASVDWRLKGAVTPVRNQGPCGSSWAFSAVGALEGQVFLKTGKLETLSPQQLVDCSYSNFNCYGGLPSLAFEFIERTGGLATEAEYNYTAQEGSCKFKTVGNSGVAHGYEAFKKYDEKALMKAVATRGPISVAFTVFSDLYHYTQGVFQCVSRGDLNHAVLLVGYGTDKELGDYWTLKNSWGADWGEDGYFRMARSQGIANCGVTHMTTIPLVSNDGL